MSGRLITIHTSGQRAEESWTRKGPPNWETLKRLVGGYIERVQVRFDGKLRDAYVNEDGLGERLPYNAVGSSMTDGRSKGTSLVGPMVIWVPDPSLAVRKPPKRADEREKSEAEHQIDRDYGIKL